MTQRGCLIYDKFIDKDPYYNRSVLHPPPPARAATQTLTTSGIGLVPARSSFLPIFPLAPAPSAAAYCCLPRCRARTAHDTRAPRTRRNRLSCLDLLIGARGGGGGRVEGEDEALPGDTTKK